MGGDHQERFSQVLMTFHNSNIAVNENSVLIETFGCVLGRWKRPLSSASVCWLESKWCCSTDGPEVSILTHTKSRPCINKAIGRYFLKKWRIFTVNIITILSVSFISYLSDINRFSHRFRVTCSQDPRICHLCVSHPWRSNCSNKSNYSHTWPLPRAFFWRENIHVCPHRTSWSASAGWKL